MSCIIVVVSTFIFKLSIIAHCITESLFNRFIESCVPMLQRCFIWNFKRVALISLLNMSSVLVVDYSTNFWSYFVKTISVSFQFLDQIQSTFLSVLSFHVRWSCSPCIHWTNVFWSIMSITNSHLIYHFCSRY